MGVRWNCSPRLEEWPPPRDSQVHLYARTARHRCGLMQGESKVSRPALATLTNQGGSKAHALHDCSEELLNDFFELFSAEEPECPPAPHEREHAAEPGCFKTCDQPAVLGAGPTSRPQCDRPRCRARRHALRQARRHLEKSHLALVVQACADSASQHLPTMNCAFAAQKLGVLIDTLALCEAPSMLLQQAAALTGGLHLRPDDETLSALCQYLITCCLPDQYARQFLRPPAQGELETRALCFLTKRPLDIGHACSVCLAVFGDDKLLECPVCSSRFTGNLFVGGAPRKKVKKKAGQAAAATAATAAASGAGAGA